MRQLPTLYYLTHFYEFCDYLQHHCPDLLRPVDRQLLADFRGQAENVQCVLVRALNRKYAYLKTESLFYAEINDNQAAINQALRLGWLQALAATDLPELLIHLGKAELLSLARVCGLGGALSTLKKAQLRDQLRPLVQWQHLLLLDWQTRWLRVAVMDTVHYGLFLFFGHVRGRLNQFSLRDLGIIKTRQGGQQSARFSSRQEATYRYHWACRYAQAKQLHANKTTAEQTWSALAEQIRHEWQADFGSAAADHAKHATGWLVAKGCLASGCEANGHALLALSQADEAVQKRIRLAWQAGEQQSVQQQLAALIDNPPNEALLVFAEDFYAQKFKQKRTSQLTDVLRQASRQLCLDECHKHHVEQAVVQHYQQQGLIAKRLENHIWRALFALLFWDLLHQQRLTGGNEFDRQPSVLQENRFYQLAAAEIERRLALFSSPEQLKRDLLRTSTMHYGKANGLFRWYANLYEDLQLVIDHCPWQGLQNIVRAMAMDYQTYKDGFPDIAVIRAGQLTFEEIKAEGDTLRRNQLLTIRKMQESGLAVGLTRVQWGVNPSQVYAVVDIETTGGRKAHHRITEIGVVLWQQGKIIKEWQSLLNPQRMIPKSITHLTGITNQMVSQAPSFADIANELSTLLAGCVFVAHNVNFDYGFIRDEYARLGQRFVMPKLCTVQGMRKYHQGLPSYSLANLTRHFNIAMTQHHRALSDARAAAQLLALIQAARLSVAS